MEDREKYQDESLFFAVALAVLIVVQLLIIKVTKILSVICVFQWRMEKCLTSEA